MIFWLLIFFYFFSLFILIYFGRRLSSKKIKALQNNSFIPSINVNDLTVIIPFRNEEYNLKNLVSSIDNSTVLPKEFIFIDDHSDDGSLMFLNGISNNRSTIKIFKLDENVKGKKHAIRKGINVTQTAFILLLDADVLFDSMFFENIGKLKIHDMIILPVKMYPNKWFQHFFILDVYIANIVNEGIYGLYRPVMASGANFLIKRDSFLKWDKQNNFGYLGGDDLKILKDFQNYNGNIGLEIDQKYSVSTAAPQNLKTYFFQRLRWIRNARIVKDEFNSILMLLQLGLTASYVCVIFYFLSNKLYFEALSLLGFKVLLDMFLLFNFFNHRKQLATWIFIPIYEFLFPIILIVLTLGSLFVKTNWKGRPLE